MPKRLPANEVNLKDRIEFIVHEALGHLGTFGVLRCVVEPRSVAGNQHNILTAPEPWRDSASIHINSGKDECSSPIEGSRKH